MEGLPHLLLPLMRDETLDLVVGARPRGKLDNALRFRPMFTSPRAIVARKGHPRSDAKSISDLAGTDWLALPPFGHWSDFKPHLLRQYCRTPAN